MTEDKIKGALLGAAAGDALGRSLRKLDLAEIQEHFGPDGIREYYLDTASGKALLSSDLQLTLFTANGVIYGNYLASAGKDILRKTAVQTAYMDWFITQNKPFESGSSLPRHSMLGGVSWLLDLPELYSERAHNPAGVLAAPAAEVKKENHTCSACASVVRVLPAALSPLGRSLEETAREGAELAALTLPGTASKICAAYLSALVRLLAEGKGPEEAMDIAKDICDKIYGIHPQWSNIEARIRAARGLAPCDGEDALYLPILGEGWIPEEALALALFCALRHREDFTSGILAAVNRTGDSCAAASETAAILGALLGYEKIPQQWKENLELSEALEELSRDLSSLNIKDPKTAVKYQNAHRP